MSENKMETGAMLNPECQNCSRKNNCNQKTLCSYLIPDSLKKEIIENSKENIQELIKKEIKVSIGIDYGIGKSLSSFHSGRR